MLNPNDRSKKAFEAGRKAASGGKKISDNPYTYASRKQLGLSAWWEAGYNSEKKKNG